MNVGVFAWGKFDDDDQSNMKVSLAETLSSAMRGRGQLSGDPVRIHVLIRKYFVGASNNAGAIFAGVDWASVGADNRVLFHEAFYATRKCDFPELCTLGGLKDDVNNAIVKRIAQKAIAVAAGRTQKPADTKGTYSIFDRAVATMPETLRSWGSVFLVGSIPVVTPGSAPEKVGLQWAEMRQPIDWSKRLGDAAR